MSENQESQGKKSVYDGMMQQVEALAKQFGANLRSSDRQSSPSFNGALRSYNENKGYFAITRPEEPNGGGYAGLSFVVFPLKHEVVDGVEEYTCMASICIGTVDLGQDEELATLPYLRRAYTKLIPTKKKEMAFLKTSFADNTTESTALLRYLNDNKAKEGWGEDKIKNIHDYINVFPAAIILKFTADDIKQTVKYLGMEGLKELDNDFVILASWLAQYAIIRGWDFRKGEVQNRQYNAVNAVASTSHMSEEAILKELNDRLVSDRFLIIEGAPGTGKTRAANQLAKMNGYIPFFTQFHADTTYSDFVGGIRPKLTGGQLAYEYKDGVLTKAILKAQEVAKEGKKVLLIIDEINRANLANVVGPMFYLFERSLSDDVNLREPIVLATESGEEIKLSALPDNLYVVGTMNTSDRNLAVVDFALRRRFVWYTMPALDLGKKSPKPFNSRLFQEIAHLFDKYATDDELSLQPGQSYFFGDDAAMKQRLKYEIMPLMKEYFANGLMLRARDEFADLYFRETGEFMYR